MCSLYAVAITSKISVSLGSSMTVRGVRQLSLRR
jgi:hypothetical protein